MMGPGGKTPDVGEVKILCDQEPARLARVLPYHVIILARDALREDGVDIMAVSGNDPCREAGIFSSSLIFMRRPVAPVPEYPLLQSGPQMQ